MALDLKTQVPRSPFETIEGFAWLPRMIDKARATFAGTRGEYTAYPCPGDKKFLKYFGIDAKALGEVIKGGASDAEIADYVKRHAKRNAEETKAFRDGMFIPSKGILMKIVAALLIGKAVKDAKQRNPAVDVTGIDTLPKALCLEEGHSIPQN